MLSQGYQDGFLDGWSDQRDGRKPSIVPTNDFYGREYRLGYDEGVRAYTSPRAPGRAQKRGRRRLDVLVHDSSTSGP